LSVFPFSASNINRALRDRNKRLEDDDLAFAREMHTSMWREEEGGAAAAATNDERYDRGPSTAAIPSMPSADIDTRTTWASPRSSPSVPPYSRELPVAIGRGQIAGVRLLTAAEQADLQTYARPLTLQQRSWERMLRRYEKMYMPLITFPDFNFE
jgi:hypothetical protein